MSVTSHLSGNRDKTIFNKPLHRRKDSSELDVFEAARYFSGYNELNYTAAAAYREDHGSRTRGGRMSLDLPIRTNVIPLHPPPPYTAEKPTIKEKKHRQQPSSPGGRLANFLNSIFNQSTSKKKKKSKNPIKSEDLHHDIGGRKRRSSLSTLIDSKSSSNISGFRTPPAAPNCAIETPYKSYKEIRNFLDQKHRQTNSKNLGNGNFNQKQKFEESFHEIIDVDEDQGAESDSSSDLFELRIYDFDCYSSTGLPVYETTNIQSIHRSSSQISSNITPLAMNKL